MRSVIEDADPAGVETIVAQQFEYAGRIWAAGLVPILEPEVSVASPHKDQAELLLRDAVGAPGRRPARRRDHHAEADDPHSARPLRRTRRQPRGVCGCSRCRAAMPATRPARRLAADPGLIASFSRALLEGPHRQPDRRTVRRPTGGVDQLKSTRRRWTSRPPAPEVRGLPGQAGRARRVGVASP